MRLCAKVRTLIISFAPHIPTRRICYYLYSAVEDSDVWTCAQSCLVEWEARI